MHLIYAWNDIVPTSKNSFDPHDGVTRGSKSVHLFDVPLVPKPLPSDVITLNITVDKV